MRAWCAWCEPPRPALPARPAADVAAFLAAERGRGLSVTTVDLRRAAIRYLHFIAGCPVPTAEAAVAETMAGIHRAAAETGQLPGPETRRHGRRSCARSSHRSATTCAGLRDRALLLLGFAGALRRAELAAIRVEHLEAGERGLRLTLPLSKGDRTGKGVSVAIPLRHHRPLPGARAARWQDAAGDHRRARCSAASGPRRAAADGHNYPACPASAPRPIDAGHRRPHRPGPRRRSPASTPRSLGGHSLKRGALNTGMDRGVHPDAPETARPPPAATPCSHAYLELGDPFESHPLSGLL